VNKYTEPDPKQYTWELKDGLRGTWIVLAEFIGINELPLSGEVDDNYESCWKVTIVPSLGPTGSIELRLETLYDEPIKLSQIARAFLVETMLFYDAAMEKEIIDRSKPSSTTAEQGRLIGEIKRLQEGGKE